MTTEELKAGKVDPAAFAGVGIQPLGATPGGLPYPEDTDPVMGGAQAIKALAQATEGMFQGSTLADALSTYQAFQSLAGNPVYPAARWPFGYTIDPETATQEQGCNQDQRAAAFMVRKQVSCAAMGYVITTAGVGSISGGIFANLYYYDSSANWRFMCNSGASKAGAFGNTTGWKIIQWRNAGDTADAPQTLSPGIVYVVSLTMAGWTTTNPRIATAAPFLGIVTNFWTAGNFHRAAVRNPITTSQTGDVAFGARTATGNVPLLALL